MELSLSHTAFEPIQSTDLHASGWEAAQFPVFIALMLVCIVAGIWAIRAHARDRREAIAHAEARDRRLNDLTRASDERIHARLWAELDRTRAVYDRNCGEQWGRFMQEVNAGFGRLEQQLTGIETQLAGMHERSSLPFNEAMVVIQQAGLAAARLHARMHQ